MMPMSRIRSGCGARTADGHVAATPPRSVMNSRRLIYSALGSQRTIVAGQTGWLEVVQPLARVRFRPSLKRYAAWERASAMGLLTFALNVTLDGCCDHREMVANDEMLRYWTRVMDAAGAMLFGRRTYELMEDAWPQVARDPKPTPSNRDWAKKLEAKPKYVVSTTRRDFPWSNTHHVEGDLTRAVKA